MRSNGLLELLLQVIVGVAGLVDDDVGHRHEVFQHIDALIEDVAQVTADTRSEFSREVGHAKRRGNVVDREEIENLGLVGQRII